MKAASKGSLIGGAGAATRWIATVAILAGMATLFMADGAGAADKPFKISFNKSELRIGALGDLGNLPLDAADQTPSIEGTWNPDSGKVTVPKGKFILPAVGLTDPVNVKVFLGIENAATGTFDPDTGALVLDAKAGLWVSLNVKQLLSLLSENGVDLGSIAGVDSGTLGLLTSFVSTLTCGFSPMDVRFTTGSTSLGSGTPFRKGTAGAGTLITEWSQLGPFSGRTKLPIVNIDPCLLIRDMLPGLIGNLGGGGSGGGLGDLDLSALLAGIDTLDLGPSGLTLMRTTDESKPVVKPRARKPRLKLTVTAVKRRTSLSAGARFRVRVRNVGTGAATGSKVCMTGFAVKRLCVGMGRISAGRGKVRVFPARVNRKRLEGRNQHVLRPLFTARAEGADPVTRRRASVLLSGS